MQVQVLAIEESGSLEMLLHPAGYRRETFMRPRESVFKQGT